MIGRRIRWRLPLTVTVLLFWLGTAPTAAAQDFTWNHPNTGVWSSGANWMGGTAPPSAPGTELIFSALGTSSYTATNDIANPFLLKRLVLDNAGTGTITIAPAAGGGAITFANIDAEIINFATGAVTISTPVNLAGSAFFHGTGTGTVTLSGTVNDGGGGFGLTVSEAATYSFTAPGASSLSFLRIGAGIGGTVQITAGSWTLTNTSTVDATAAFVAGRTSGQTATFTLSGGATLTTPGNMFFGEAAGSTGNGTITGSGTTVTATGVSTGRLVVGNNGTGSLTISGGAVVNTRLGDIGRNAGSNGTVIVDGTGSQWTTTGGLTVGGSGTGSLTVQGGGQVSPASVLVAGAASAVGTLTVTGTGSQLVTPGSGGITTQLGGALTVAAGGLVSGHNVTFSQFGASGMAVVDAGTLTVRNSLFVGHGGTGSLTIRNGGVVTVAGTSAFAGTTSTSVGTVTVTGANSRLTMLNAGSFLIVGGGGGAGRGDLMVQNGGAVTAGTQLTFAQDSGSTSTSVVDAGTVTVSGTLVVGQSGSAGLTIQNGGTATAGGVALAANPASSGTLTVTGAGSTLSTTGALRLAGFGTTPGGTATLNVAAGGAVSADGLLTLFGGGTANVNGGALTVGGLTHGTATSIGNVNLSNGATVTISNGLSATYAGVISGVGSVTKTGTGTQAFSGANTYTVGTTINQGTLLVTNTTGSGTGNGGVTVSAGGTLGGTGRVAPPPNFTVVPTELNGGTVQAGGTATAAPTRTDVLTITQQLKFDGASTLRSTVGQSGGVGAAGKIDLATGFGQFARNTGGAAADVLTIRLTNDGTLDLSGSSTYTVTVLTYSTLDPVSLSEFTNQPNPTHFSVAAENFAFSGTPLITLSGGNLSVTFTPVPVPEPGAILAVATAAGLAAGLRRRLIRREGVTG